MTEGKQAMGGEVFKKWWVQVRHDLISKVINIRLQLYQMNDKETQNTISLAITTHLGQYLNQEGSKLSQLQQFYKSKSINFTFPISEGGKILTKKIFGAGVKCMRRNPNHQQFCFSANLVCLAEILLHVSFQDQYVLGLLLQQLHQNNEQYYEKMLKCCNPFKFLRITAAQLHIVMIEIIIKINSRRVTQTIFNILKDYDLASQIYSIFLRMILLRQNFAECQNLQNINKELDNTDDIYSFLCDYFGMNTFTHCARTLRSKNQLNNLNQVKLGEKSRVYLFNDYNMFISTVDNVEFCCGKYYSNEEDLLKGEQDIRKSTLDYIRLCKEAQIKDENQQNQDKFDIKKSLNLDLGMSNSGFIFGSQNDTPYFNSNPDTPQFGQLLDSSRFKKSLDFESALKMAEKGRAPRLGTVEQEITSPASQGNRLNFAKCVENANLFLGEEKLNDSLHFEDEQIPKLIIKECKKIDEQQGQKKEVRSPRQKDYNFKTEIGQNKLQNEAQKTLKIPVIGKKSLISNSDLRSEARFQNIDYQKSIKQLANMSVKESHNFIKYQQNVKPQKTPRKRGPSGRKYSVNETSLNGFKKEKQKNHVHYSNHFNGVQVQHLQEKHKQTSEVSQSQTKIMNQKNIIWQNSLSDNVTTHQRNEKKMGIVSRAVDIQFSSKIAKNEKHKYSHPKSSTPDGSVKLSKQTSSYKKIDYKSILAKNKVHGNPELRRYESNKLDSKKNLPFLSHKLVRAYTQKEQFQLGEKLNVEKVSCNLSQKKSPRSNKQSKFPQFLKHSKSRKNINEGLQQPNGQKQNKNKQITQDRPIPFNYPYYQQKVEKGQFIESQYFTPPIKIQSMVTLNKETRQRQKTEYRQMTQIAQITQKTQKTQSQRRVDQNLREIKSEPNLNKPIYQGSVGLNRGHVYEQHALGQYRNNAWVNSSQLRNKKQQSQYNYVSPERIVNPSGYFHIRHPYSGQQVQIKHYDKATTLNLINSYKKPTQPIHQNPYNYQNGPLNKPVQMAYFQYPIQSISSPYSNYVMKTQPDYLFEKERERQTVQTLANSKMYSTKAQTVYTDDPAWRSDGFKFIRPGY